MRSSGPPPVVTVGLAVLSLPHSSCYPVYALVTASSRYPPCCHRPLGTRLQLFLLLSLRISFLLSASLCMVRAVPATPLAHSFSGSPVRPQSTPVHVDLLPRIQACTHCMECNVVTCILGTSEMNQAEKGENAQVWLRGFIGLPTVELGRSGSHIIDKSSWTRMIHKSSWVAVQSRRREMI